MIIPTIDVDKVKELLDSYWKKWQPYECSPFTGDLIDMAQKDMIYRLQLYNDLLKRNDSSHFYPFRTILERLLKYELIFSFEKDEREGWLFNDIKQGWRQMSKLGLETEDDIMISNTLEKIQKTYKEFKIKSIKYLDLCKTSKILESITSVNDKENIYRVTSGYVHGSLLSAIARTRGNDKEVSKLCRRIIIGFSEQLATLKK